MATTHMEFASALDALTCPVCARQEVREAVLVNSSRLVLASCRTCAHCGRQRHRWGNANQLTADRQRTKVA